MYNYRSIPRVIARLDIKGPNLVKGISFEGLRVLGKPEHFARTYYQDGADELVYMDAVASLYGRNSLLEVVERTSRETFIPLTVGGGIRSLDDIRQVLRAGADKVSLNTAAIERPDIISEAAQTFGSSTVVVSIEAYEVGPGKYEAYQDYGRQSTGLDAIEWAKRSADLGAGEIMVTSVNRDGTGKGLDLNLTRAIATQVAIPVISGGGAGSLSHIGDAFRQAEADAIALASVLHYDTLKRIDSTGADFSQEGNVEYLRRGLKTPSRIHELNLPQIKQYLRQNGVPCRTTECADV